MSDQSVPDEGSVWRHFKGGHYRVVCLALDSETSKLMVVYRSNSGGSTWVRPFSMWHERVPGGGRRFEEVKE